MADTTRSDDERPETCEPPTLTTIGALAELTAGSGGSDRGDDGGGPSSYWL